MLVLFEHKTTEVPASSSQNRNFNQDGMAVCTSTNCCSGRGLGWKRAESGASSACISGGSPGDQGAVSRRRTMAASLQFLIARPIVAIATARSFRYTFHTLATAEASATCRAARTVLLCASHLLSVCHTNRRRHLSACHTSTSPGRSPSLSQSSSQVLQFIIQHGRLRLRST